MSDVYLPEWKPWKVRAEELEKLRAKDRATIDTFYQENFKTLEHFARYYYLTRGQSKHLYSVEDMLQDAYLDFFTDVDFSSPSYFQTSLKSSMYYSAFGGRWNKDVYNAYVDTECRNGFFSTYTKLDEPLFDDTGRTLGDVIPGGLSPHAELMKERERRRQDKIENDLEPILRRIFTPRQFEQWSNGLNIHTLRAVIRRHSDELLQFLREHGTPEHKLQGNVVTAEEERARVAEQKARRAWEEAHLDELSEEKRREVKQRIYLRERRRQISAEKKARASK